MATINRLMSPPHARQLAVVATVLVVVFCYRSLMAWPQIGPDEDVFKTVDALFTAINSKDPQRLNDCEQRLQVQRESGKLPTSAAKRLDRLIQQARAGKWEAAARRLYDLMLVQRGLP